MYPSVNLIGIVTLIIILAFGLALRRKAYDPVKRIVDLTLSLAAIVAFSPIMLVAALAIKLDSKGPIFHFADRVGAKRRRIKVWKLRTMVADADRYGNITGANDSRITRVGSFLRATKIDELPQLINVVLGTMSIVGPRPESAAIVERYYTEEDNELFDVPPGLTCPGTLYYYIHYDDHELPVGMSTDEFYVRNSLRPKLAADLHYVRHRRLSYDFKLIFLTVVIILVQLFGTKLNWLPDIMRPR